MTEYIFPKVDLTPDQELWLKELYEDFKQAQIRDVRLIKIKLSGKISRNFSPTSINPWLINFTSSGQNYITIMGIWYVDPTSQEFEKCNRAIGAVSELIHRYVGETTTGLTNDLKFSFDQIAGVSGLPVGELKKTFALIELIGVGYWRSIIDRGPVTKEEIGIKVSGQIGFDDIYGFEGIDKLYAQLKDQEDAAKNLRERDSMERYRTDSDSPALKKEGAPYVNKERIAEFASFIPKQFDMAKLVRLCEELNISHSNKSYYSVAMLCRAIVDHVPPIFRCPNFDSVTASYPGTRSFKDHMGHLNDSLKHIADAALHVQIRRIEDLPNETQVDFSNDIDVLLGEVCRLLK